VLFSFKVRLNHLDKALEITRQGDFQVVYDLSSAYYHIRIAEEHQEFLGAAFENSDGSTVFFKYCHLPFGLASAVHIITKIWKPLTQYLNGIGIRNTIYIDDGRILAESKEEAVRATIKAFNVVTRAGWAIEKSKSDMPDEAGRQKKYLGFVIDSDKMVVSSQESKLIKIKEMIEGLVQRGTMPVKKLAAVLGKIISLEPSHGMITRVSSRSGYALLAERTENFGWSCQVELDEATRRELLFFSENVLEQNGSLIKTSMLEVRLESILDNPVARRKKIPRHERGSKIFVSDSSEVKTFVCDLSDGNKTVLSCNFTEEQRSQSSGMRELLAVWMALNQWNVTGQLKEKNVYWLTDSENVCSFLQKGSRKPHVQDLLFQIVQLAFKLKINITPIHLLRSDPRIMVADEESKRLDSDNWSVDYYSFQELNALFGFETDMFSDGLNARLPKFCTQYFYPGSLAIDAFSVEWEHLGMIWMCPPISLLVKVHFRINSCRCRGVIVLPVWKTSNFFNLYFKKGVPRRPFSLVKLWHPYIFQNENARKTALFGQVPYSFAALAFNTCV
jgi:hypothetical protein